METCPTKKTTPFSDTFLKCLSLLKIDSIADITFFFVDLDLIFDDCEYSFLRYAATSDICLVDGIYNDINSVALPL